MQQANTGHSRPFTKKQEDIFATDAGHPSRLPEDTLREYAHIVGRFGIAEKLEPVYRDPCDLLHIYVARLRTDLGKKDGGKNVLQAPCVGKGMTDAQARASALGEMVERYSAIFRGEETRIKASYRGLRTNAIHPNACMNFSASQYRERERWNQNEAKYNWVPAPFDENREIEWTPVWSLTEERFKYVATALCYFGYPFSPEHDFCRPDSNGNAAGNSLQEATLHGFLELVERDCAALWWYNEARRPQVELESFGETYFLAIAELYRILKRRIKVFDISSDFPIPAFAATSTDDSGEAGLLLGFGAHLEPRIAIAKAITEMNQSLVQSVCGEDPRFFVSGTLEGEFLSSLSTLPQKRCDEYQRHDNYDLLRDLRTCVDLARKRGLQVLVLDQTRADVGMPATKVLVPGMRSWWARFAPGRLYDVPVQLGWLREPLCEEQLNPCHLIV